VDDILLFSFCLLFLSRTLVLSPALRKTRWPRRKEAKCQTPVTGPVQYGLGKGETRGDEGSGAEGIKMKY
jgi:hypothetical protein